MEVCCFRALGVLVLAASVEGSGPDPLRLVELAVGGAEVLQAFLGRLAQLGILLCGLWMTCVILMGFGIGVCYF